MATSAIPAAIDYLVTTITALDACAAPVVVCDGWPDKRGNTGVVIGVTPDDDDTDNQPTHAELGANMEWEEFAIPCIVWAHVGEANMKTARDNAFTVFNAIVTAVRVPSTGRTLGGALNSGAAIVQDVQIRQTATAMEAGEGRSCEIYFVVRCRNRF